METPDSRYQLKKHTAAIQIEGRLSLLQRKCFNILLLHAYPELLTKEKHWIRISDLATLIGFNSNNTEYLIEEIEKISRIEVRWNIFEHPHIEPEFQARGWDYIMPGAKVDSRGILTYYFGAFIRPKLYQPGIYALINLLTQKKLNSKYGLILYENCLQYARIKTQVKSTGMHSLDDWRRIFDVTDKHQDFRDFRRYVITPAVKEVNQNTNLTVKPKYDRNGRKVVGLGFDIVVEPSVVVETLEPPHLPPDPLYSKLGTDFGATEQQAAEILDKVDRDQVLRNLDYVKNELKKATTGNRKPIVNVWKFTEKSIFEDWAARQRPAILQQIEAENKEEKEIADQIKAKKKKAAVMAETTEQERVERLNGIFGSLTAEEQVKIDQEALDLFFQETGQFGRDWYSKEVKKGITDPEQMSMVVKTGLLKHRLNIIEEMEGS